MRRSSAVGGARGVAASTTGEPEQCPGHTSQHGPPRNKSFLGARSAVRSLRQLDQRTQVFSESAEGRREPD